MIKKTFYITILSASSLLLVLSFFHYHADLPLKELKARYTYSDSHFVEVQDMHVHYRRSGAGVPLLLIHGTGSSLHTWEGWTEELKEDFEIVSLDLPAFGLTGPHPKSNYSIPAYVDFLNEFVEAIGLDTFYLAGNSLGGFIAWEYALAHPDKARKLILVCSAGWPRQQALPLALRLGRTPVVKDIMKHVTPRPMFEKTLREVYFDDSKITDELVDRYFELFLHQGNRQAYIDRIAQPQEADPKRLAQLDIPVLIQWGVHDPWIPVSDAYLFLDVLPNARLIPYDNAAHVPMEEIPEQTAADARGFLLE
ncbi:MAG: alpha/beta hydrolase [Phaeodactylibacter sp.]|nr:alpha/beta hydrolase [Phaeodactylibacter sp.]